MITKVYTIYDLLGDMYSPLMQERSDEKAIISFRQIMDNRKSYDREYRLYRIGSWNDEKGEFIPSEKTEIVLGSIFQKEEK